HTLERPPTVTSPTTVAVSAMNADGSIWGRLPPKPRIMRSRPPSHLPLAEVLVAQSFQDPGSVDGLDRLRLAVPGQQHHVPRAARPAADLVDHLARDQDARPGAQRHRDRVRG